MMAKSSMSPITGSGSGQEVNDKFNNGETITSADCYFFSAPTFQTKSETYGWLNGVQAIGKMVEIKRGDHITYDIFVVK